MIKQYFLYFIFFISLVFLFSSCTIFGFGKDSVSQETEEEYYDPSEGEEIAEETSEEEGTAVAEGEGEMEEETEDDILYIDEEDADYMASQGEEFEVEEEPETEEMAESEELDEDSNEEVAEANEDSDSSGNFFTAEPTMSPSIGASASSEVSPQTPKTSKKTWIPLKKIKTTPYQAGGFLVNAVYIARQGEDLQSISNKIFGSDQTSQLNSINSYLKKRNVKTGDKIYYSSPTRPNDSNQLLFYFEDKGLSPLSHEVSAGQNIRTIATQLLGHSQSWKEIWATNLDLQSKWIMKNPITIKYWSQDQSSAPAEPVAQSPEPQQPEESQGEAMAEGEMPEENEEAMAPEPPPAMGEGEEGAMEEDTPPPSLADEGGESDGETTPLMGKSKNLTQFFSSTNTIFAVLLALIGLICVYIVIKKRTKKQDFDYTAGHFEVDK